MSIFKKIRNMYRVLSLLAESHQTHINLPVLGSAESLYRKYSKPPGFNGDTRALDLQMAIVFGANKPPLVYAPKNHTP